MKTLSEIINKSDYLQISKNIQYDINTGIYDQFPVLKNKLNRISEKLFKAYYVINFDPLLSEYEKDILIENDYITF